MDHMGPFRSDPMEGLSRACPTPPDTSRLREIGKAAQIMDRLARSFSNNYLWTALSVLLVVLILVPVSVLPRTGRALEGIAEGVQGKKTSIMEVRALTDDGFYAVFYDVFLDDVEHLDPLFLDDWECFFAEEDVKEMEALEGVEAVVRVLDVDASVKPEKISPQCQDRINEWIKEWVEDTEKDVQLEEIITKRAASWNMTPIEYVTITLSFNHIGMRCIEVNKIQGWDLGFNEVVDGHMVRPGEGEVIINEWLCDDRFGFNGSDKMYHLVGQRESYQVNGTWHQYDKRHIYTFDIVGYTPLTAGVWSSSEPNIITDLDGYMAILQQERHENASPLPLYSSLLVKPATSLDYPSVEKALCELYPEKRVMRAGSAPTTVGDRVTEVAASLKGIALKSTVAFLGLLSLLQLFEAHKHRKEIWTLKLRGWGNLELLSYIMLRMAFIGLLAGLISGITLFLAKPILLGVLVPYRELSGSPELTKLTSMAIEAAFDGGKLQAFPLFGVTVAVLSSVPSVIFSLVTRPRVYRLEPQETL